jgi:hypothetical protein
LVSLWQKYGVGREVVCREDEAVAGCLWPVAGGDG